MICIMHRESGVHVELEEVPAVAWMAQRCVRGVVSLSVMTAEHAAILDIAEWKGVCNVLEVFVVSVQEMQIVIEHLVDVYRVNVEVGMRVILHHVECAVIRCTVVYTGTLWIRIVVYS